MAPQRRGSIRLSENGALITLFAKRDLSTLLHEGGHLFLESPRRTTNSSPAASRRI